MKDLEFSTHALECANELASRDPTKKAAVDKVIR